MTEIRFYHLQRSTIAQTLPGVLEKALERGMRAVIHTADPQQVKEIDEWLWAYKPTSFLPHGCDGDPHADQHPIWITASHKNPNNADLLIVMDAVAWDGDMDAIKMRCEMFDGGNDATVQKSRDNWAQLKEAGHTLSYWQQDNQGRWQQKQ